MSECMSNSDVRMSVNTLQMELRLQTFCEHILANNQTLLPVKCVSFECWEMKFFVKVGHTILT